MDIKPVINEFKTEILILIKERFSKENAAITNEVTLFVENSKEKLERWSVLLLQGEITKAEFEILLQSQKDLLHMHTLHKAGVSAIQLGQFKNAVLKLIFNKITFFIGI